MPLPLRRLPPSRHWPVTMVTIFVRLCLAWTKLKLYLCSPCSAPRPSICLSSLIRISSHQLVPCCCAGLLAVSLVPSAWPRRLLEQSQTASFSFSLLPYRSDARWYKHPPVGRTSVYIRTAHAMQIVESNTMNLSTGD